MPAIDQIVNINITNSTTAVATQSFAIPLILGTTNPGWTSGDVVHAYSAPSGMLTDGFVTSSPEYIAALAMYAQTPAPTSFEVGRRSAAAAQVDTLTVNTLTAGRQYKLTVNGTVCSYTAGGGDTQQAILTALNTSIQAAASVTGAVSGTGSGATLTLTANTPGQAIQYTAVDTQLTRASTTAANGIANDLAAIMAQDNRWYGLVTPSASDADILQAAAWAEGNTKFYVAVSSTVAISGASTTDLGSTLKAAGYKRTALLYSTAAITQGIDAAWAGSQLSYTPGANNWAFKQLAGISVDALTPTQQATLIGNPVAGVAGKNVNIYQTVGGVNVTQMGTTASGQYADITVGIDWLRSTTQTNVYQALVSAVKVPYTNAGVAILIAAVRAAIDQGATNGLIDANSDISVTAPSVLSVSPTQRANRIAPTITFSCRLQGAFNSVIVNGSVSV